MKYMFLSLLLSMLTISCQQTPPTTTHQKHEDFGSYWYQGKAEITSFTLTQFRYKANYPGTAVHIFVTEDFLKKEHVKYEKGDPATAIGILKLNSMKNFTTGIYPYSIMQSVFSPVELSQFPHALKMTFSSQDWCGQSYQQLNFKNGKYSAEIRSYFQEPGDGTVTLPPYFFEEDLWTKLRIQPNALPIGEFQLIPSAEYTRLYHQPLQPMTAIAKLISISDLLSEYEFNYPAINRTVSIQFEKLFPFKIESWKEVIINKNGEETITTAKVNKRILSDYWTLNSPKDSTWRAELGLN